MGCAHSRHTTSTTHQVPPDRIPPSQVPLDQLQVPLDQLQMPLGQLQVPPKSTPTSPAPTASSYPVPFGYVPYNPSLPDAMGPIEGVHKEWWYYGGWAQTESQQFTIFITLVRNQGLTSGVLFGIGTSTTDFVVNNFPATGSYPTPTPMSWSIAGTTANEANVMSCKLTSGTLGLPGATYQLNMTGHCGQTQHQNTISVSLVLKDNFGMVLETALNSRILVMSSYEFAMPLLSIEQGSTITMPETPRPAQLLGGSLWLDRQTMGSSTLATAHHIGRWFTQPELYTGDWLAIVMDDAVYMMAFFWPQSTPQWIVGTAVGIPPNAKIGLKYPSLTSWNGQSPVVGVTVLEDSEYDLNITNPQDPDQSPHWTSKQSTHTYCSAWTLRIGTENYSMKVFVPGAEVGILSSYAFYEGAAAIYDASNSVVGHCFVEQMGYN